MLSLIGSNRTTSNQSAHLRHSEISFEYPDYSRFIPNHSSSSGGKFNIIISGICTNIHQLVLKPNSYPPFIHQMPTALVDQSGGILQEF